ncbi:hypothetical protein GCM10009122_60230 [Fulvivirga kasyanovii]|uniref:STAS/SEC14 domain-containing protein n=1 Tax=Fulvivirga kasyanovii TaxID=396812 RepID=A0ABW9RNG7_9BACT|nr:hypothetical protein [Fulvivirga kasyanovii]MTI25531.1 hypothetical protein [Fulvivirga kasyanovii]
MQTIRLYTLGESTIDFDPSVPCIVVKQIGFLTSDEFREIQEKALDLYVVKKKEYGKLAWLSNIQESDAVEMESLKWAAEDLTPRSYQAGNRYSAVVLPEEEYTMASMNAEIYTEESVRKANEQKIETRMFKDEASAKMWLRMVE